jgi:serine/threonine protein kinase
MPEITGKGRDPLLGRVIAGKFEIQELLGVGAMGRVYKAHNSALDKRVAVKVLSVPDGVKDPSHAIRFKAEARAASRIDHENSVQILDFGTDGPDNLMYIAMELLQGQNLGEVLKRVGKLSQLRACNIMMQVLGVLQSAHRNGVVHRDLKPANIMLVKKRGDEGEVNDFVKVCDFGIAKVMEVGNENDATAMTMTRAGAVFGTPAYMSPEQARGEKIDFRTDIFSCGVILYRMIAGKTPFSAETAVGLLTKLMMEEPVPLSVAVSTVDPRLEQIVRRAMMKDRSQRFQSATDMRTALKEVLGDPRAEATISPQMQTQPPQPVEQTRSRSISGLQLESVKSALATPVPGPESTHAAPFQTLTSNNLLNRTSTWSGQGTIRPPVVTQEKTSLKKPLMILAAVVVIGLLGVAIKQWNDARNVVSKMMEMNAIGSYGIAENLFHEHYESLKDDPRARALIPEILAKRREVENDEARFGVKVDPSFSLQPARWLVIFKEVDKKREQRYYFIVERADETTFEGYLDWQDAGIKAAVRGMHHGNHLVFWDYKVLSGSSKNYTIDDKKNVYLEGERLVGTDGPFLNQITGTLQK